MALSQNGPSRTVDDTLNMQQGASARMHKLKYTCWRHDCPIVHRSSGHRDLGREHNLAGDTVGPDLLFESLRNND